MAKINWYSIKKKAEETMAKPEYKKKLYKIVDETLIGGKIHMETSTNRGLVDGKSLKDAAEAFMGVLITEILTLEAESGFEKGLLGATAVQALTNLECGEPKKIANGKYVIPVNFAGDLHRDSLDPVMYEGVDNIAALLEKGYEAAYPVSGVWEGHYEWNIESLQKREGAKFIEKAVENFMENYAHMYNVKDIKVDDVYK